MKRALALLGFIVFTLFAGNAHADRMPGKWVSAVLAKPKLGAIAPQIPILPTSWGVANWYVDPANAVSGACASDNNNCTSATCGSAGSGVGPCRTWHQINDVRWGCQGSPRGCPRLRQTTTVNFLSSHTDNTDPVYAFPTVENSGSLVIQAALPTPSNTGNTFTVASNWGTCVQGIVRDNAAGTFAQGGFVVDLTVTGHAAFWCDETAGGGHPCQNSIPMTVATAPPSALQTPGLWGSMSGAAGTLTVGDSYNSYNNLVSVNIAQIQPAIVDWNGSTPSNGVFVYHVQIFDPAGAGQDPVSIGPGVSIYESRIDRVIQLVGQPINDDHGCVNCWINGGAIGGQMSTGKFWHVIGGQFTSNESILNLTGTGIALDGFVRVNKSATFLQGVSMGLVFNQQTMGIGGYSTLATLSPGYASVQNGVSLCGSGTTDVLGSGTLRYDSSHSGSAGAFGSNQVLQINGLATACTATQGLGCASPISITVGAVMDNAVDSTHFGGRLYGPWGGSIMANLF